MSLQDQLQQTLGTSTVIEHELDGGGMSRVFVATDTTLGRRVVVKVLPSEMSGPMAVERFKLEISIAARLQHAHMVPLLIAGQVDGQPYFTMPFVEGQSLRARLDQPTHPCRCSMPCGLA
jgi:serine/threonine-protein kinase